MPNPTQKANLLRWLHLLETTPEAQHIQGALRKGGPQDPTPCWCALGLAAEALDRPVVGITISADKKLFIDAFDFGLEYGISYLEPPTGWMVENFGLGDGDRNDLIHMNDDEGKTFLEIATYLRELCNLPKDPNPQDSPPAEASS